MHHLAFTISSGCLACGVCTEVCSDKAIIEGDIYQINSSLCTSCGNCADICPVGVIKLED
ncbi:MAG TPA: 4Fe-4S binding protein [Clostridia bacterium]|nr:4Fe-4S binding protein [Clostridia bacterium]